MRNTCALTLAAVLAVSCDRPAPLAERAVYRVDVAVTISGIPVDGVVLEEVVRTAQWAGSATAVSPDGDLLTVRHLADVGIQIPGLCYGFYLQENDYTILHSAKVSNVELTVYGPNGNIWMGLAFGSLLGEPPCDAQGRLSLIWMADSEATIDAVDDAADLALIRIQATGLPHLRLDPTPAVIGEPVVSIGRYGNLDVTHEDGEVVVPCVMQSGNSYHVPAMPVLRISQMIWPGMSGGPVASGDRLLGINARVGLIPPFDSYAVPNTYVSAWYDWVRGVSSERPSAVCPPVPGGAP